MYTNTCNLNNVFIIVERSRYVNISIRNMLEDSQQYGAKAF